MSSDISERSLFVVGDDAQSIYGFRGSSIELILNFEKFYPGSKEIVLNQNYRSTQPILDLAEQVLSLNPNQKKKNLFANNQSKDLRVHFYQARNEKDEGDYIVRDLFTRYVENDTSHKAATNLAPATKSISGTKDNDEVFLVTEEMEYGSQSGISSMFDQYLNTSDMGNLSAGTKLWFEPDNQHVYNPRSWQVPVTNWSQVSQLNDCVILYRTHAQSRAIEEALLRHKVPYRLVSGTRFLDRKEVRDVVAILRFLSNGNDNIALSRFLPLILEGVGAKTLEKIFAFLEDPEYPLAPKVQKQISELLTKFANSFVQHDSLIDLTKHLLVDLGYYTYLKKEYPNKEEFLIRSENIAEIFSLMLPFDENTELGMQDKLTEFLAQIMLMSNADTGGDLENSPKINLMTLHQSKGLEFETVYLVGIEDGLLPHQNSLFEPDGLEEEVRLAYVGITRAKKHLHLIAAGSRLIFGQVKNFPLSRIFRPFLDRYCIRVR